MTIASATPTGATIRQNARRAAFSGFVGSSLEYYDIFIYASASALIFGRVFFPDAGSAGTLLSVGTLGAAYVARPLGAVIWGHYGDRVGRRRALFATLLTMGVATVLIGCLPSYGQIGIAAPIMLVVLRLVQGISAGGEAPGSSVLSTEHAPAHRRAFFGSFTLSGTTFGVVLGTIVFIPVAALPEEQLLSWGWRIPFWISILITGVAWFVRRTLPEPETFDEMKASGAKVGVPLVELFRRHWRTLLAVSLFSLQSVTVTIVNVFGLAYATQVVGISSATMLTVITVANLVSVLLIPFYGMLADRFGRKPVFVFGAVGVAGTIFGFFSAISSANIPLIFLSGIAVLGFFYGAAISILPSFVSEQFPANVRYSGVALASMLGLVVTGFLPAVGLAVTAGDPANWLPVAWITAGFMVVAIGAASSFTETYKTPTAELGDRLRR